jgi:hypothetical protein
MGLQITSEAREIVEIVDFAPSVALGEASAHSAIYGSKVNLLLFTTFPLTVTGT